LKEAPPLPGPKEKYKKFRNQSKRALDNGIHQAALDVHANVNEDTSIGTDRTLS
jgi:hypothetical protein